MSELKPCPIKMVEIYGGNNPDWGGFYNLITNDEHKIPIAGPLTPVTSEPLLTVINAWNTRNIPEGYKLVPIEPTQAMLDEIAIHDQFTHKALVVRYKAMLEAADEKD